MNKVLKWVFGIAIILFIIGIIFGGLLENNGDDKAETSARTKPVNNADDPPFQTTATEIASAYADNSADADKKYRNKAFIVTGKVVDMHTDAAETTILILEGGLDALTNPHFSLAASEKTKAAELKQGQKVKLQCYGNGDIAKAAQSEDCEILFIEWQ